MELSPRSRCGVNGLPPFIRLAPLTPTRPPTYLEDPLASVNDLVNLFKPMYSPGPGLQAGPIIMPVYETRVCARVREGLQLRHALLLPRL